MTGYGLTSPPAPSPLTERGVAGEGTQQLPPNELFHLRRTVLEAEGKELAAQMARLALRQLVLEIERKHRLLGTSARLDIHTGIIELSPEPVEGENEHGPGPDAHPPAAGPA